MGRYGGGSSSGGSHGHSSSSSSSHSSSSGGGSSVRTSTSTPFYGCYNRSYYDRRGHYHTFYTSDRYYGTRSGWSFGIIFALLFITIHMFIMIGSFGMTAIEFGGKVKGDSSRIQIVDNTNMLTEQEENKVSQLFEKVYDKSGMPVALYTTDYEWKNNYIDMEVYSEVIYYKTFKDENSMVIVFSSEKVGDYLDYEYGIYCGDNTVKCLKDEDFDNLIDDFNVGLIRNNNNIAASLDYSFGLCMDNLAKTKIHFSRLVIVVPLLAFYSIFYIAIFSGMKKKNQVYKYFKENPDKLDEKPMKTLLKCPSCGGTNTLSEEKCPYCGTFLKIN